MLGFVWDISGVRMAYWGPCMPYGGCLYAIFSARMPYDGGALGRLCETFHNLGGRNPPFVCHTMGSVWHISGFVQHISAFVWHMGGGGSEGVKYGRSLRHFCLSGVASTMALIVGPLDPHRSPPTPGARSARLCPLGLRLLCAALSPSVASAR